MHFNASYDVSTSHDLEDEPSLWQRPATAFGGCSDPPQNDMQELLRRSWSMPAPELGRTLRALNRLDDTQTTIHCLERGSHDMETEISPRLKLDSFLENGRSPSDLYPLIPKQSHGYSLLSYDSYSPARQSCHSTPRRLEELKNWLWLQQEQSNELNAVRCLHLKWLNKSIESLRNLFRRAPVRKWLKYRRKEKLILHNSRVHAALSVASVAAAIAAVAAATASSAADEKDSRTGMVVASAAALVAARCADFAQDMGADHDDVAASVNTGGNVKSAADILNLTASASSFLQAARPTIKPQKEGHIYAAFSPCERQTSPSTALSGGSSAFDESEAECYYTHELLARGCEFLMRSNGSKLHWRFMCVFLNRRKQVILKLHSRHLIGMFAKTEKSVVFDILMDVPAWPGRSLLHNGIEKSYFGLVTSNGKLEFECRNEFDYQLWTDGVSHLLLVAKQHKEK